MTEHWKPEGSAPIAVGKLLNPLARSLCAHICGPAEDFARLIECREHGNLEFVSFDVDVPRPQRPVYDIRPTEGVTVCFARVGVHGFSVLVARPDFPDTPHQNVMPEGEPSCLCIDDRPWQDTGPGYTAAELMARLSSWFEKACHGELHGSEQPLDPLFFNESFHQVILGSDCFPAISESRRLYVRTQDPDARFLFVTGSKPAGLRGDGLGVLVIHCEVEPQRASRMRRAPRDLGQLAGFLAERGVDLLDRLQSSISEWFSGRQEEGDDKRVTCFLVTMPMIDPASGAIGANQTVAFIAVNSPGEIGESLGMLTRNTSGHGQNTKFLPVVGAAAVIDRARDIEIDMVLVHPEFEAARASALSGAGIEDRRRVFQIGAGSLGSAVAENLAREGRFKWTIADDDLLLPHNLARHTLTTRHLAQSKAGSLAERLTEIRRDVDARALGENVLRPFDPASVEGAMSAADLILDFSASVPVSRWASDHPSPARRACAFFTPDGKSAVVMIEDADRSCTLRDLEAAYLREILQNEELKDHLGPVGRMRYTGACRALTNTIPASSVQILAGLISEEIARGLDSPGATLRVWSRHECGMKAVDIAGAAIKTSLGDWTVSIPLSLRLDLQLRRSRRLPDETGGPLMGFFDRHKQRIDAVFALDPPEDSVGTPSTFLRGISKLRSELEKASARAGNQVRYIGEWHSHPTGHSARPSVTDLDQIAQLAKIMECDGLPAISVIVSESDVSMLIGTAKGHADE